METYPKKKSGFSSGMTLLELMVVLAIIGIALTMAIPAFLKMRPHYNLKNAASEVSSEMTLARMKAISERRDYTVVFNLTNNNFTVTPSGGGALLKGTDCVGVQMYRDASDPNVNPFTNDTVSFLTDGTAPFDGEQAVYMKTSPYNGERYRVSVLGGTGKISMEHWAGGKWVSGF